MEKSTIDKTGNVSENVNETAFMAEFALPLRTKLLFYLDSIGFTPCEFVGTYRHTQPGIAGELGITWPHAAILISEIVKKDDYIEKKLLHVPGHNRRVLCFFLTPRGKAYIMALKREMGVFF